MTVVDFHLSDSPDPAGLVPADRGEDRKIGLLLCAVLLAMFLLLQNPYWVPGGDSEVYVAIARNLVTGQNYRFNGQAARIAPPGWPLVLAGVMKISPTFLALKLTTLLCMLAGLATYYRVLRRFASPKLSAGLTLLTAVISHVYPLTYWLHSDAVFVLITAGAVLISLQINEGKPPGWRIAALLLLCVAGAFVRWAGIINITLIAGALLQGRWRSPISRRQVHLLVIMASVIAITAITFFGVRWWMTKYAPSTVSFEDTAQMDLSSIQKDVDIEAGGSESLAPAFITGTGKGSSGYGIRMIGFGTWFSYLLWQPFRLAMGWNAIWWIAAVVGWLVIGIFVTACFSDLKKHRWLLPVTFLYSLALCLNWPQANARYLVPITPLLLVGIVRGIGVLRSAGAPAGAVATTPWWKGRAWTAIGLVGIGSIILSNATFYAVDVWVMRADHFYDHYEAGLNKGLIAAADYLSKQRAGNWQTAINFEYINVNNRRRLSPTGLRGITMLTGKACLTFPDKFNKPPYKGGPIDREARRWFGRNRVIYYLEQPPISPWRVWHFRMGWLQKLRTGVEPKDSGAGWKVYRCHGAEIPVPIELPELDHYPTRIPGL